MHKDIEGFNPDGFNLNYHATDTFARVHQDLSRFLFIRGPVGSGKSSGCIWHCVLNAMKQEPDYEGKRKARYGIFRATYPSLKTTVVNSWKNWFGPLIKIVYDIPIRGKLEFPFHDGTTLDIELLFIALDREEEVNKVQSLELTGAHINEAAEIQHPGVFNILKTRIRRYPEPLELIADPFIIQDYNSPDTEHWLYKLSEEEKPEEHSFYHQPAALLFEGFDKAGKPKYINNPLADNWGHKAEKGEWLRVEKRFADGGEWVQHLHPKYYTDMVHGSDPAWVNVFILNNYGMVRKGKPVYPEYDDNDHAAKEDLKPLQGIPIVIGMDLGLTPAAAFCQLSPTGQLQIFDELVEEDMSIKRFCKDRLLPHIATHYRKWDYTIVIDPSGSKRGDAEAKSAFGIMREMGLPVRFAKTNEPLARREAVVYFLEKRKGFQLSPKCKVLRKGFISEYHYPKYSSAALEGKYKPKPDKNMYSHVHDGLQYACLELSEGRVIRRKAVMRKNEYSMPATDAGY